MNFSALSIKHPIPAIMLFVLLTLAGILSYRASVVQDFPDIELPIVTVSATLSGAAPAQLETEVARKIEDSVATLQGVKNIYTKVLDGDVTVTVEFILEKPIAEAVNDVRDAVARVRADLPADVRDPSVTKASTAGRVVMTFTAAAAPVSSGRATRLAKVLPGQSGSRAQGKSTIESLDGADITLASVTLHTPNYDRILVKDLSVTVKPGEGLMIVGESGSGKSSLLRAIAGLWRSGSGTIYRPREDDILFLPQQPYMLLGTLRSQLLYPNHDRSVSDEELLDLLGRVNLPDLAARFGGLDVEMDWHNVLSVGEQQRLGFARLLLTRPLFAILDEATSALDSTNEASLYRQLEETRTTLISVGHRSTILKYHKQVLELTGDSEWQSHPAASFRFSK